MKIGSHVSMGDGLPGAAAEAVSYGANVFMIYTGAPQNTRRSPIEKLKPEEGQRYMEEHGLTEFVVHAPYIVNLASCNESTYELAVNFLAVEILRTEALGAKYLVLHPGAYTEKDLEYGIARITAGLDSIFGRDEIKQTNVVVCLETMAGKGTEIGRTFGELRRIIDASAYPERLAVCFDTCHVHDAGYDIINDLDGVMREFDETVGLERLKVFHINGSLNPRGGKKDRHANIGAGEDNPKGVDHIGLDAIRRIAHSEYAKDKLLILETPWLDDDTNLYKEEIEAIRCEV